MFLTKLKIAFVVLLAIGMVGTGAGLLCYGLQAAEQPSADEKAKVQGGLASEQDEGAAPPKRAQPQREAKPERGEPQRNARVDLAKAREELVLAEAALLDMERRWGEELIKARQELMAHEEALRVKERAQEIRLEGERADVKAAQSRLRESRDRLNRVSVPGGNQKELDAASEAFGKEEKNFEWLEAIFQANDLQRSKELLKPRRVLLAAQERLRLLELQQALQRDRARAKMEAAEDRIRQLEGGPPRADSANRRLEELERKVDRLLREMAELRKEVRRQK